LEYVEAKDKEINIEILKISESITRTHTYNQNVTAILLEEGYIKGSNKKKRKRKSKIVTKASVIEKEKKRKHKKKIRSIAKI